ncbi:MAG TPA: hypothetical protein VHW23_19855 [Kofleriaceae bacterium]|jgi:hypothetical protein|nr:hypothetical protein [Kofleriaceae bacterium]
MSSGSRLSALSALLWLAAAGCGKVTSATGGDAMPPMTDGGVLIDANMTPVAVTVLTTAGDGKPDATAKVVFQDPDGVVVADLMVDAQGHAQSPLPRGGSVTAVAQSTSGASVTAAATTITGVVPGDTLTFGQAAQPGVPQGGQTSMTVTFPLAPDATLYSFSTPCGTTKTGSSPAPLNFRDSCHGATFDLLGTTIADGVPMYVRLANVTYQAGNSFAVPTAFAPMPSYTVTAHNVPAEVSSMSVSRASLAGNLAVSSTSAIVPGDPPAGNVSVNIPFPAGFGTRSELDVIMGRADAAIPQHVEVHTAALGTSADVDVAPQPLPWITNFAQTATGATWTQVAAGDGSGTAMLTWTGTWSAGGTTYTGTRTLVRPLSGVTNSMILSPLPATYMAIDPVQQSVVVTLSSASLVMGNYDMANSDAQIRQMPQILLTDPAGNMGALLGKPFQRRIVSAAIVH